jgi:hypothetical protein
MPKLQLNYNEKTGELVGWSEDTANLNIGTVVKSKVVDVSDDEFSKIKDYGYLKSFDGKNLVFKDNQSAQGQKRQKELIIKLKDGSISNKEQQELLLLFLGEK